MKPGTSERKLAEAHGIMATQVSRAFETSMKGVKRDWDKMLEFTTKYSVDEKYRLSWMSNIMEFKRSGRLPEEVIDTDADPQDERPRTFADDWELWIRNQFAIKISQCTSISEVGSMMPSDTGNSFRRSLWNDNVFIRGIRGGIAGIVEGDPGTGKTMFVCQEMIEPLSHVKNIQIVSNIAIKSFSGKPRPDNVKYASTIPKALRYAIKHSLEAILYIEVIENKIDSGEGDKTALMKELNKRKNELKKHPYLTVWVIDEAGISKDKHDAMSNEWKTQRHISMISRKLKIYQLTIYQFDDAPDDIIRLSHHRYSKPDLFQLDKVSFSIRNICPETTLTGILDDVKRKEYGMPYVEYDTDDTSGMSGDEFDTQAMLQYINTIAIDGAIGSKAQFERALEYIDNLEQTNTTISSTDGDFYFLYHVKKYYNAESERLILEAKQCKTRARKKDILQEAKVCKSYTRVPFLCKMAKGRYPDRNFYDQTLKREFEKLEKKYPNIMDLPIYEPMELPALIDVND